MPATESWRGSASRPDAIYVVRAGDSLSKIAATYYYNTPLTEGVARIAQANGLDPTKPIQIGQRLKIPGGGSLDPASENDAPETATRKASTVVPVAKVVPGFPALDLHDWRVWAGGGLVLAALYFWLKGSKG